jgi:hypothetical protein
MYVFTCNDFEGFYPVGTAAVVVANNEEEAKKMLIDELDKRGLPQTDPTLTFVHTLSPSVHILCDGNY